MAPVIQENDGPLKGTAVIELGGRGPVPFAGALFADQGADVIRIDRVSDALNAHRDDSDFRYHPLRRGKRSVALDLKDADVLGAVLKLVETSDVVLDGFRPGVSDRLGIGPEDCLGRNSRVIFAAMSGWSRDSLLGQRAGHDINYIAAAGALGAMGAQDTAPDPPLNLVGDYAGGALFVTGILSALISRERTGVGAVVNSSIYESTLYYMSRFFEFMAEGEWVDRRKSNIVDGGAPFYTTYETGDGAYLAVGCLEDQFYKQFVDCLGLDIEAIPSRSKRSNWSSLRDIFAETILQRTQAEWWAVFKHVDACVTPVLSLSGSVGFAADTGHQGLDWSRRWNRIRPTPIVEGSTKWDELRVDEIGSSTVDVLRTQSGLTTAEISRLLNRDAIFQSRSASV